VHDQTLDGAAALQQQVVAATLLHVLPPCLVQGTLRCAPHPLLLLLPAVLLLYTVQVHVNPSFATLLLAQGFCDLCALHHVI
jgi:hypothetical protein